MGTLSEELAVSILRNFHLAQITVQSQWEADLAARLSNPPVWRWTPGTFVFPEGLCCYCGGVMASPAIWRTDNLQFLGSWKVVGDGGEGRFEYDDKHPHVLDGAICMGGNNYRASSVGDALFLAFNPLSMYFGGDSEEGISSEQQLKAWFADRFNHRCGENSNTTTIEGIDIRHAVAPEAGCHCQHCRRHRGEVQCPRETCRQWYDPNTGHGRFRCEMCSPSGTFRFCVKHRHDRYRCADCGDTYDLYDVRLGVVDPNPRIKQCGECEAWVCWYCLGEAPGSERMHSCGADGDEDDDEDEAIEEHTCCGCDRCCECGGTRVCSDCGNFAYECTCNDDEDTEEEF